MGCQFLLQCMKVKSESEVAQSCDPMHCSLPGSSIHGIFQARVLEWGAIAFSVESLEKVFNNWQVSLLSPLFLPNSLPFFTSFLSPDLSHFPFFFSFFVLILLYPLLWVPQLYEWCPKALQ